jgi:signal transduction histidine kinase
VGELPGQVPEEVDDDADETQDAALPQVWSPGFSRPGAAFSECLRHSRALFVSHVKPPKGGTPYLGPSVVSSWGFSEMKKSLLVLLLAVLLPSLVLGWLALRSAQEQQIVFERRTAELYQKETETVATAARSLISAERRAFAETLRQLLIGEKPQQLAGHFAVSLRSAWPQPAVGFALTTEGMICSPNLHDAGINTQVRQFLAENGSWVSGKAQATAYPVPMDELNRPEMAQRKMAYGNAKKQQDYAKGDSQQQISQSQSSQAMKVIPDSLGSKELPNEKQEALLTRNVAPQQQAVIGNESQLTWATADFREFIAEGNEGVVNRFVNDKLNMIFWIRPAEARNLVFGCLLRAEDLAAQWPDLLPASGDGWGPESDFILALLNDKAQPAAVSPAGSSVPDWKKPFVATEIGEALPHWEAALYLRHPERLVASAQKVRRNLYLLISCALGAIAIGGWVVMAETRRQLTLAQKKTDFVSNVSHELKTPLTSIRMFAEMMHSGRATAERQPQYLRIIMVEAERLTRLINNVLDFAGLERRQRRFEKRPFDLFEMLTQIWSSHEVHLSEAGFTTNWESAAPPYPVIGDEDALAQVLVNLLANAEKYGGERKEITLRSYLEGPCVCVSVLDRGPGVPAGEESKIFEPFYRAHDSLSSGIPGTGLGLSLARRIVQEHGGEILYQARPGGGSNFTMRLPLRAGN